MQIGAAAVAGMMALSTLMVRRGAAVHGSCVNHRLTALMLPCRQAGRQNQ